MSWFCVCRSITRSYYRNSVAALLLFDVTSRASFESIPYWLADAKRHITPYKPVLQLVGTKVSSFNTYYVKFGVGLQLFYRGLMGPKSLPNICLKVADNYSNFLFKLGCNL